MEDSRYLGFWDKMTFNTYKHVNNNNVITKKRFQVALTKDVFLNVIMEQ